MSRTLIHYSSQPLRALRNEGTGQQASYHHMTGKPNGFWYAYGDAWKEAIESGRAGLALREETLVHRYEFQLPESAFVSAVEDVTPDTIFELRQDNLNAFMQRFLRPEYRLTMDMAGVVQQALTMMIQEGESAVFAEWAATNDAFQDYYDELMYVMTDKLNAGEDVNVAKEARKILRRFPRLRASPSAMRGDRILSMNWVAFWNDVALIVGGVEFHADILGVRTWGDVELTWTGVLGIPSGVVFHPTRFREGVLVRQLLQGGFRSKRPTRSKRSTSFKRTRRSTRRI